MVRNYTAEKFWHFYYHNVFEKEANLHNSEGIELDASEFPNNFAILEQFEHPVNGVFSKIESSRPITREEDDFFLIPHHSRDVEYTVTADFWRKNSAEVPLEIGALVNKAVERLLENIHLQLKDISLEPLLAEMT
jgi:myosin heavy subunit